MHLPCTAVCAKSFATTASLNQLTSGSKGENYDQKQQFAVNVCTQLTTKSQMYEVKKLYRYVTDTKLTAQLEDMGGLRHAADKCNLFHNGTVTTVTTLYF